MPKKNGIIFVIAGAVLIISALLLLISNKLDDRQAQQEAEILLTEIKSVIPSPAPQADTPEPTESLSPHMPIVLIDGYDYIGYLSIPDLELVLPVLADWDYTKLEYAPCRHFGSSRTDDLVIAAHNFQSHFGNLDKLEIGAEAHFTDMDGINYHYLLKDMVTVNPDEAELLRDSGYDLVLYTCTYGGATRIAAFFDRGSK